MLRTILRAKMFNNIPLQFANDLYNTANYMLIIGAVLVLVGTGISFWMGSIKRNFQMKG